MNRTFTLPENRISGFKIFIYVHMVRMRWFGRNAFMCVSIYSYIYISRYLVLRGCSVYIFHYTLCCQRNAAALLISVYVYTLACERITRAPRHWLLHGIHIILHSQFSIYIGILKYIRVCVFVVWKKEQRKYCYSGFDNKFP